MPKFVEKALTPAQFEMLSGHAVVSGVAVVGAPGKTPAP
jgi:hypothetical protein